MNNIHYAHFEIVQSAKKSVNVVDTPALQLTSGTQTGYTTYTTTTLHYTTLQLKLQLQLLLQQPLQLVATTCQRHQLDSDSNADRA